MAGVVFVNEQRVDIATDVRHGCGYMVALVWVGAELTAGRGVSAPPCRVSGCGHGLFFFLFINMAAMTCK